MRHNKDQGAAKMMKSIMITLSLMTSFSGLAMAETKTYSIENQKFSMDVPAGWRDYKDLAGSPLTFFGPESSDGPRTVVLIAPTGKEDKKNFFSAVKTHSDEYKKGRENWLKGSLGEAISFDPSKEEKWAGIERALEFGYNYEVPSGKFYERSVYILCGGNKVFYIKSLVPEAFQNDHNPLIEQTIKSLKCEKTSVKTASN